MAVIHPKIKITANFQFVNLPSFSLKDGAGTESCSLVFFLLAVSSVMVSLFFSKIVGCLGSEVVESRLFEAVDLPEKRELLEPES